VWTLTVGTVPAAGGTGYLKIAGETVQVDMAAGDSAATVASAIAAKVGAYFNALTGAQLPVTASAATNVVTLTARHKGLVAGDLSIKVPARLTGNAFTGVITVANPTAPTGVPDTSTALSAIGDAQADFITLPWPDSTNLGRYKTFSDRRWGYNVQAYDLINTCLSDTIANLATAGQASNNDRACAILGKFSAATNPQPSYLWAAAYRGATITRLSDDTGGVSTNMTGFVLQGISPPEEQAYYPDRTTRETLLQSNISTWKVTSSGEVVVDKEVTSYRIGSSGQPDSTFTDVQVTAQCMIAAALIRTTMENAHANKSVADRNPAGNAFISTPGDVFATWAHAVKDLETRGIVENSDAVIDRGYAVRNLSSADRVDALGPLDMVNPLDIIAIRTLVYAQLPTA
jgi:phage tail sheath gpL-like